MSERKMTVSGLHAPGWHNVPSRQQVPMLLLAGLWMRDAGFYPGCHVRVGVVGEGRVVITRADAGEEDREWRPLVWVPADQIGRIEEASARRSPAVPCG